MLEVHAVGRGAAGARLAAQVDAGSRNATGYLALGLVLAVLALVVMPMAWGRTGGAPLRVAMFFGSLFALSAAMIGIGVGVTGQRMGVLWTSRNAYSLSRLQIVLWTLLVLAALAAVVACRSHQLFMPSDAASPNRIEDALNIFIPPELLAVMGISLFSAAAAPAILSVKSQSAAPADVQLEAASTRVGGEVQAIGRVAVRPAHCPPLVRDLFQGDEIAKAGTVDIGKLQQAIVTFILWTAYLAMVVDLFVQGRLGEDGVTALPALSDTFVYLLGISHAGYLAYKAAPAATADGPGPLASPAGAAEPSRVLPRPAPPVLR
jgi:hypothetical protein